jgi:AraC-like DNA-binding protein
MGAADVRSWTETDLPGESLTIGCLVPGVELMSVRNSRRLWREQLHEAFTVVAVAKHQPALEAIWRTRCRSVSTTNGGLMMINAGDGHVTHRVSGPASFEVLKIAPRVIEEVRSAERRPGHFRFRSPSSSDPAVLKAVLRLRQCVAEGRDGLVLESSCADVARRIATRLGEVRDRELDPVRDYRLRNVRDLIHVSARGEAAKPRLTELAAEANLCQYRLCALFKRTYGLSIGAYWTGCRVAEAKRLLIAGAPAKDIAAALGFADEPQFVRFFRRECGLPPGRWRDLYRSSRQKAHAVPRPGRGSLDADPE